MNSSGPPSAIEDALARDHAALDEVLGRLKAALSSDLTASRDHFNLFRRRLVHHMDWEEKHLFPTVKPHCSPKEVRSIESLEIDHDRIRETMEALDVALNEGNLAEARACREDLGVYLAGHNYDEEHGVYEEADRYLDAETTARILGAFRGG